MKGNQSFRGFRQLIGHLLDGIRIRVGGHSHGAADGPSDQWDRAARAHRLGNLKTAIKLYTGAVDDDPACGRAHIGLAKVWLESGHPKKAEFALNKAIKLDPRDPKPRMLVAVAKVRSGEPERAIVHCDTAIGYKRGYLPAYGVRGMAKYAAGDYLGAIGDCDHVIAHDHMMRTLWFAEEWPSLSPATLRAL